MDTLNFCAVTATGAVMLAKPAVGFCETVTRGLT